MGIPESLVRYSTSIEHPGDLISDLDNALSATSWEARRADSTQENQTHTIAVRGYEADVETTVPGNPHIVGYGETEEATLENARIAVEFLAALAAEHDIEILGLPGALP